MDAYQMFFYFIFYAFLGWAIEVCYMTNELNRFENRGFLYGPINPIYGFGVLIIVLTLSRFADNILLLFVSSVVICTTFELAVGIFLEKVFHNRWWTYEHEKFNFKGIICLKVSLLWGLGCCVLIKLVHPFLVKVVDMMPAKLGITLIVLFSILIFIDMLTAIVNALKISFKIKPFEFISNKVFLITATIIGSYLGRITLFIKRKIFRRPIPK